MKTIEQMDQELAEYVSKTSGWEYHPVGCTFKICKLEDQRNEVVAQRDKALDLLREIVEWVEESTIWLTDDRSHPFVERFHLPRNYEQARELVKRKEGQ